LGSHFFKSEKEKLSDDELKKYDIVVWHKGFFELDDIRRCKQLGIPTVIDFDDHWVLNPEHTLAKAYQREGASVKLHKALLYADYVTCTTELLADQVAIHNKNVCVLPNAMDMNYEGCKVERRTDEPFSFGYVGGHYHIRDVALLRGVFHQVKGDYRLRLFGFDGSPIYTYYADVLSDKNTNPNFELFKGLPIWAYPQFYNRMDCSLIPLEANRFNMFKSELKMIEAGFFKKAVIVSNVHPYKILINKKNCLAVDTPSDWVKHCRALLESKQLAVDLGENLYQSVQKYNIEEINKKRYKFYQDVHKKLNINSGFRVSRLEVLN
jgi:hypothetical protein